MKTDKEMDEFVGQQKCCSLGCVERCVMWDVDKNKGVCKTHTAQVLDLLR